MINDEEQGLGENIGNKVSSLSDVASSLNNRYEDYKRKNNNSEHQNNSKDDKLSEPSNKPSQEGINNATNNTVKNSSHNVAKNVENKASKEIAKEAGKEIAKEGVKAAGRATAAASTAGVSEAVYQATDKLQKAINTIANNKDTSYTIWQISFGIFFALVAFIFIAVSAVISLLPGPVNSLLGTQITATNESKYNIGTSLQEILNYFSLTDEETMNEYDNQMPYRDSIDQNVKMCKKYVKKAYDYQIEKVLKKYCSSNDYDYDLSVEKTKAFNSKNDVVNNYNYTYLICIAGQTVENTVNQFKVSDYKTYFKSNYIKLLQSQENSHGEETMHDSDGNSYTVKYCVFEIKCIPITTMYSLFNIAPDSPNPIFDNTTNSVILPYNVYLFKKWAKQANIDIGTDIEPTEFANSYGEDSIDTERLENLEKIYGDLTTQQQQIVSYAMSAVGCKYDQKHRLEEGIYDCSSLCARAYLTLDIQMGAKYPTSANMCKYLVDNECEISKNYDSSIAQPGDLIFWKNTWNPSDLNSRFRNITHVAIYVGNGQMVSAASTKSGVVFKEVKSQDKIVSVCRPLYLQ